MQIQERLQQLVDSNHIREFDYYFASQMIDMVEHDDEQLAVLFSLASYSVGQSHVCLDLKTLSDSQLKSSLGTDFSDMLKKLSECKLVADPGDMAPFILDDQNRLYLSRYWHYEQGLAKMLIEKAAETSEYKLNTDKLSSFLASIFDPGDEINWQQVAVVLSLLKRLVIISGGPGTGKTYTVAAILAAISSFCGLSKPKIALCAPTGKAAARLSESIRQTIGGMDLTEEVMTAIPQEAMTIHRLLKYRGGAVQPFYHRNNRLHHDVIVIDEASMIDLPMMYRLFDAIKPEAHIIMLGDRDQLASVEAGNVLSDICTSGDGNGYSTELTRSIEKMIACGVKHGTNTTVLDDNIVRLQKSYRFSADQGIGKLAHAVNKGSFEQLMSCLDDEDDSVKLSEYDEHSIRKNINDIVCREYIDIFHQPGPEQALELLSRFKILCATKNGMGGIDFVNNHVEKYLVKTGIVEEGLFYKGKPILIIENDYNAGLFNGDTGVFWSDPHTGEMKAWFETSPGALKAISPSRLPRHETAYAMTIHKSQGSEFDRVLMVLPLQITKVLSRELVYTGITRARRSVEIWSSSTVLERAIHVAVNRMSGLADKLSIPK